MKLDKTQRAFASSALRRVSHMWPARSQAKSAARVARGEYECASCHKVFGPKEIQLDHIEPVVPTHGKEITLDEEAQRLLVYQSGWAVLCKLCHKTKTAIENAARRENKKCG